MDTLQSPPEQICGASAALCVQGTLGQLQGSRSRIALGTGHAADVPLQRLWLWQSVAAEQTLPTENLHWSVQQGYAIVF